MLTSAPYLNFLYRNVQRIYKEKLEERTLDDEDEKQKLIKQMGIFVTVPFVLSVPPVLGWLIGNWLDTFFGTSHVFMYLMIVLGLVAGFREFYRIIKRFGDGA